MGASLTVPLLLAALSLTEATAAEPSLLTLSAELPADDLSRWLSETAPAQLQGQGGKKVCQRVLGFKVCGNANWNYLVERTAPIDIPQVDINAPSLTLAAPLSVNGTVGVDGDIGKALGLDAVPVKADMTLILNAVVSGNALGCPQVKVSATPQWAAKPEATLPGNIKINLTDTLESALSAQVANWQKAVNEALDCDAVLSQLKPLWSECYANATRAETGPALWRVQPHSIHWSLQTARPDRQLALVVGLQSDIGLQFGLTAEAVNERLQASNCETRWNDLSEPTAQHAQRTSQDKLTNSMRLKFNPALNSKTQQAISLDVTHEALSAYAQANWTNRNLGKGDGGSEVFLKSLQVQAGEISANSSMLLETQFSAKVRSANSFLRWLQELLGIGEESIEGVMSVDAAPVWDGSARSLRFERLQASVTQVDDSAGFSVDDAVFVLLQKHVQKTLAEQSTVAVGPSIDAISMRLNETLDTHATELLEPFGARWDADTAAMEIVDIASVGNGVQLDAELNANWVIRVSSEQWPRDLGLK